MDFRVPGKLNCNSLPIDNSELQIHSCKGRYIKFCYISTYSLKEYDKINFSPDFKFLNNGACAVYSVYNGLCFVNTYQML